jgi:anti-sigma factor RsiW
MASDQTSDGSAGSDGSSYTGTELSCRELVELVTAYREGSLPPDECARFDAHLAICPPCVRYVEQLDLTVRALGGLNEQVEQAPATQELLKLFRTWKAGSSEPAGE